jgi:hypothetical protein
MSETAAAARTDFLDRLVNKALGAETMIAPRLQSLFEPAQATAQAQFPVEDADRPGDIGHIAGSVSWFAPARIADAKPSQQEDPPAVYSPLSAPNVQPVPQPLASSDDRERRTQFARGAIIPAEPCITDAPSPVEFDEPSPRHRAQSDDRERRIQTTPALRAGAEPRLTEASSHLEIGDPSRPTLLPMLKQAGGGEISTNLHPHGPNAEPHTLLVSTTPYAIEPLRAVTTHQSPRTSRREKLASPSETSAPIVNVTIGRVEVRALSVPAAKPARARHVSQPLGLDEYLKRRDAR